jgi:hypothetical protein
MNKDALSLILVQIASPAARFVFAFMVVPFHPEGNKLLEVLVISELISVFLTAGRNYLVQAGYNHNLLAYNSDKLILSASACAAFFIFSTEEQQSYVAAILISSISISLMSMYGSAFLRDRLLYLIVPINILTYAAIVVSLLLPVEAAVFASFIWFFAEIKFPKSNKSAPYGLVPVIATFLAFLSQRIDLQIAALFGDPSFLKDVFYLNTLFMPLALFVRIIGNTSLLRGVAILGENFKIQVILAFSGTIYGFFVLFSGMLMGNELITSHYLLIIASAAVACMAIPYREKISICSRQGIFRHILLLSILGVVPSLFYLATMGYFSGSSTGFIVFLYLLPRVFMYMYGVFALKKVNCYG